jgi:hypothetical protein
MQTATAATTTTPPQTKPRARRVLNPLATLSHYFAFVFAAGGIGVGLCLGVFINAVAGALAWRPAQATSWR